MPQSHREIHGQGASKSRTAVAITPIPSRGINPVHIARVSARKAALRSLLPTVIPAGIECLVIEIGCGHGHFLTRYASEHPDRFCLGIDILADRLRRAEKKRERAKVENLRFIKAEAEELLDSLAAPIRFSEVLILFPDPWPKKRHHKNRLIKNGFLTSLASRMTPVGRIYFRTDHEDYFAWTRTLIQAHTSWVIESGAEWVQEETTVFQAKASRFESLVATVRIQD